MLVGATLTVALLGVSAACGGGKIASDGSDGGSGSGTVSSGGVSSGGTTSSSGGFGGSNSSGGIGSSSSGSGGDTDGGFAPDSGTSSGGPDCGQTPSLHANPPGDIYCGYDTDGGALECISDDAGNGGFCCLGGSLGIGTYAPEICADNAAGCMIATEGTNPIPIQCNQISDCPGNGAPGSTACCLIGATPPAMPPGCSFLKSTHGTAIQCEGSSGDAGAAAATSCAPGEVNICSSDADCPTGMTCQPGKWKIYQLGFCQ
jgi:hypothetical protein